MEQNTPCPVGERGLRIAFLGDSITEGYFEIDIDREGSLIGRHDPSHAYPTLLKEMLETVFPDRPVTVINAGKNGESSVQGAKRVETDLLAHCPDLAIVCFGLNDLHGEDGGLSYFSALRSIFKELKNAGCKTVFMTPNMVCTKIEPTLGDKWLEEVAGRCAQRQKDGRMDALMRGARSVCAEEGVPVCDCYGDWKALEARGADITGLLSNSINHPTRAMHRLFAARLFETIFLKEALL